MAVFQSLGELGSHLAANRIEVVDPGIPLTDMTALGTSTDVSKKAHGNWFKNRITTEPPPTPG